MKAQHTSELKTVPKASRKLEKNVEYAESEDSKSGLGERTKIKGIPWKRLKYNLVDPNFNLSNFMVSFYTTD